MRVLCLVLSMALSFAGCKCGPVVTKIQPSLTVAPTGISFDNVKVGDSAVATLRLNSMTNTPVTIKSITLEPGSTPGGVEGFTLGTVPSTVDPLGKASVTITFHPMVKQGYSVTAVVSSDDAEKPTVRIPVVGDGALPVFEVTPDCAGARMCTGTAVVSPPSLDFGMEPLHRATPIDATKLPSVNVVNSGPVPLTVTVHAISGADAAAFTFAGNGTVTTGSTTLDPANGFNLPIRFVPTSQNQQTYAASLVLDSDDPEHPTVTIALTGALRPNTLPTVCANLIRVSPPANSEPPREYSASTDWMLTPPSTGYDFRYSRDVRPGDLAQFSAVSNPTDTTACTTDAEDGRSLSYQWTLTSFPMGALPPALSASTTSQTQLRPVVSGEYTLELTVTDSAGGARTVSMQFAVAIKQDLVAQLEWAGFADVDLDLHLVRPQPDAGSDLAGVFGYFSEGTTGKTSSDINGYSNGFATMASGNDFNWGSASSTDDPRLNVDEHGQGDLVENISLNNPEHDPACQHAPCVYKVLVHYFADARVSTPTACTVTGAPGCRDGEPCTCATGKTCVADGLPAGDAGIGSGKCLAAPHPVVRLFFKGSATPAATIPLPTLSPADQLTLGAPCQMLYVADVAWPSVDSIGSLPDAGTPPPVVTVKGADNTGRVVNAQISRWGYRQNGGSLRCSPDIKPDLDWYSRQP